MPCNTPITTIFFMTKFLIEFFFFQTCAIDIYSSLMQQNLQKEPLRPLPRIFLAIWLIFCLLMSGNNVSIMSISLYICNINIINSYNIIIIIYICNDFSYIITYDILTLITRKFEIKIIFVLSIFIIFSILRICILFIVMDINFKILQSKYFNYKFSTYIL